MERKIGITWVMISLLLIGVLMSAVNVQPVKASGTIYIRAGGSIGPPTAPIQRDSMSVFSAPPPTVWNQTYGDTYEDAAYSVVQTSDGGYALAGYKVLPGHYDKDFWLIKTNSSGNMMWNKTYGGATDDEAYSVIQTVEDEGYGYLLAGYTKSFAVGKDDVWLVKTYANGTMQWNQTYGGTESEWASSVVQPSDGGYVFAGSIERLGFGYDFLLYKIDSSGNFKWKTACGTAYDEFALSMIPTRDGGYAVAGYANTRSGGPNDCDCWLVKFGGSGGMMWNKTYGFIYGIDVASSLVQTVDGGYALAGYTQWESGPSGPYYLWLIKTDSTGNGQWNEPYGGTHNDLGSSLVQTSDGGYALAGYTQSFGAGNYDMWLIKLGLSNLTDSDEDGLYDVWETDGIDYDFDGTIDFSLTGANPQHKDIYLEIDYMNSTGTTHDHRPDDSAITSVISKFANAPINNPDSVDGIALHIEVDDQFLHQTVINVWDGFNQLKESFFGTSMQRGSANKDNVLAAKRLAYRYCLFIHQFALWSGTQWVTQTSSGIAELPGNDFIVSLGTFANNRGTSEEQARTLMHELGHTLNLRHGGGDNINGKPNYLSIMSYTFQLDRWNTGLFDYSREKLPSLNESNLNEKLGIQGTQGGRTIYGHISWIGQVYAASSQGPIDWDVDNTIEPSVAISVNDFLYPPPTVGWGDGLQTPLESYNDWANLKYNYRLTSEFSEGVHLNIESNEITSELDWEMKNTPFIGFHDVAITNIKPFKTIVGTGYSAPINITVANQGYYTKTFSIILYANTTLITSQNLTLTSGNSTTITFTWNTSGFAKGNYTIKTYATPVDGETDTTDNTLTDGWIIVSMVGDICSEISGPYHGWPDGRCDMSDIYPACKLFGIQYPNPKYNANFDLNNDHRIDMTDIYDLCKQFGKKDP